MHPLQELDLSPLFPKDLRPLSDPVPILDFDLANPPLSDRTSSFEVKIQPKNETTTLILDSSFI